MSTILEHWAGIEKSRVNVGIIHTKLRATIIKIGLAPATTPCCACHWFALARVTIDVHSAKGLMNRTTSRGAFNMLIRRAKQTMGWLPAIEARYGEETRVLVVMILRRVCAH